MQVIFKDFKKEKIPIELEPEQTVRMTFLPARFRTLYSDLRLFTNYLKRCSMRRRNWRS